MHGPTSRRLNHRRGRLAWADSPTHRLVLSKFKIRDRPASTISIFFSEIAIQTQWIVDSGLRGEPLIAPQARMKKFTDFPIRVTTEPLSD